MTETTPKHTLICDTECYHGFWLVAFKRVSDGKVLSFELSDRSTINIDRLRAIMKQNRIITFNGQGYDIPLIYYAIAGATNAQLKQASDRIINGNVRHWEVSDLLSQTIPSFYIPKIDHIDLIEPQPNAFASLKTLNGRLHGKKMQDLPFEPDTRLTHDDMTALTNYCGNDLDATELQFVALEEPIALRETLSEIYGMDLRSKSDAQMGEAIIKKRVEQISGERAQRVETPPGTSFKYPVPDYLHFETPELRDMVERLRETEFYVKHDGKVDMPAYLHNKKLQIDDMEYAMGIGGLHSTEKNRAVHSDDDHILIDVDVAFYYPSIIINSGLYPRSLGRPFLEAFGSIKSDRLVAKRRAQEIKKQLGSNTLTDAEKAALNAELSREVAKDKGGKIQGNGCFGKLGSKYSVLYAPHLLITVTLTGQLAILMLIDRARCAGISAVSANTDGVVFRVPRADYAGLVTDGGKPTTRLNPSKFAEIIEQWERDTGFELEANPYRSLYSQSVNTYIAVQEDGKVKRKGVLANPRKESPPDIRTQLMINPSMNICSDAVVALITKGTPLEETIRGCDDIREFVTVVNVKGGGVWVHKPETETRLEVDQHGWPVDGKTTYEKIVGLGECEYLGKVVRYIWSKDGSPIYYKDPHPRTGNFKKVSKSDGCRPVMELPDELPADLDYDRYIEAAREILMDIGYDERPPEVKPIRLYKHNALLWWALAA